MNSHEVVYLEHHLKLDGRRILEGVRLLVITCDEQTFVANGRLISQVLRTFAAKFHVAKFKHEKRYGCGRVIYHYNAI